MSTMKSGSVLRNQSEVHNNLRKLNMSTVEKVTPLKLPNFVNYD